MKKVLVGTAVAVLAVPAFAQEVKMPTVYGQVNRAITYATQKKEQNYNKMGNLLDVANSESRLGAKGTHEVNTLKVNYNLLVGLDSSNDSAAIQSGTGRLRIRNVEISFADAWGTVFAGQTGDIVSAVGIKLDPLLNTVAGVVSADQAVFVKNATTNVGFIDRGRYDQIGYKTPEFMGFQFAMASAKIGVTTTSAAAGTLTEETADSNSLSATPGTRYASLLSYTNKFNDMFKMEAYAGYNVLQARLYKDYNDYMGALSLTYGEFTLNGQYTKLQRQLTAANSIKVKNAFMQSSVKWARGDHAVALTYANRKNEEDTKTAGTDAELGKYSQIAFGYMYNLNKYVQLRGVYGHYTVKTDKAAKTANWENKADFVSAGAIVTF